MRRLHELLATAREAIAQKARRLRDERGITGLETAIILIAFVVVAAVFAFVVLSTGLFSSERGKEAVYAGLSKTRGTMELTGGVIATSNNTNITKVTFDVTLAAGGDSVNLRATDPINRTVISYIDANSVNPDLQYTTATITGTNDGLLQPGELMSITVDFTAQTGGAITIGPNQTFVLEVKPPTGSYMVIQRTIPPAIAQPIIDLY
ncbi:MAG TPA: archaellin/type IV pilin N-terminal domain-containing protein [Dehalococcoidia bacterium]|nr:archaellin/type IV pilin N-terminal domain-containing protein [Dehalococcoidia bacterium]